MRGEWGHKKVSIKCAKDPKGIASLEPQNNLSDNEPYVYIETSTHAHSCIPSHSLIHFQLFCNEGKARMNKKKRKCFLLVKVFFCLFVETKNSKQNSYAKIKESLLK